jgi:ATP-dependent DNA ligase
MTTLYKTTKTGAIQQWSIEVSGDTFTCTFGQLGGKMQSQSTKCAPRNVGRSNETTPEQQAQLEAEALITKKQKSGYSFDKSAPVTVNLPMKVKSYQDQLKNVKFPCISTPKLNGVNAIYKRVDGELTIYSRGGEVYPAIPHLEQHIHEVMNELNSEELNGELYIHGEHLQDIQSAVKKPKELSERLTLGLFDICDFEESYKVRNMKLHHLYLNLNKVTHPILEHITFLTGVECNSHEDIESHYNQCIASNLEGTVIKNLDGLYKHNVRSSDQFKYKKAQSKEFLIASYELDKNGLPVFIMNVDDQLFKAKPKGTKEFWSNFNPADYINQWATIEFETYSKAGIPLKPIFISLRAMDSNGEPKE